MAARDRDRLSDHRSNGYRSVVIFVFSIAAGVATPCSAQSPQSMIWQPGHWSWTGTANVWIPGRYVSGSTSLPSNPTALPAPPPTSIPVPSATHDYQSGNRPQTSQPSFEALYRCTIIRGSKTHSADISISFKRKAVETAQDLGTGRCAEMEVDGKEGPVTNSQICPVGGAAADTVTIRQYVHIGADTVTWGGVMINGPFLLKLANGSREIWDQINLRTGRYRNSDGDTGICNRSNP
jgi:WXXGXW repeat (2 copies)